MEFLRQASLIIVLAIGGLGANEAARAADVCDQDLPDLVRFHAKVSPSEIAAGEMQLLLHWGRQWCAQGRPERSREHLIDAWSTLLEDSALTVPSTGPVMIDTCTSGIEEVREEMAASGVGDLARDAAGSLVEDAVLLCEQGEELDAQDKLAMAWSMLTEMP